MTSDKVSTSYLLATLRINGELVLGTLATHTDKSAFQDRMQSRLWGLCAAPDLELGTLKAQHILEDLSGRTVRELPSSHTVTGVLENAAVKAAVDKVLTSRLGDANHATAVRLTRIVPTCQLLEYVITHKKAQLMAPTFGDDGPEEWVCGAALVLSTGHDVAVDEQGWASPGIWNKVHLRLVLCVTSSTNPLLDSWRKDGNS